MNIPPWGIISNNERKGDGEWSTKGVKGNISEAAIRALEAGVDITLVCTGPKSLVSDVTAAVTSGRLSRIMMIKKVTRILNWKEQLGIIK